MLATLTREIIHVHTKVNKQWVDHEVFEGEARMSQEQQDYYKQLIGDGQASVTVSRELSEGDFGNGGKTFVSITLTCDQSGPFLTTATEYAKSLAESKCWEYHGMLKQQLLAKGILKS